jgi:hypothetical protein
MISVGRGRYRLKTCMNGLKRYVGPWKRYIGPGLVISVLVHVAPLLGGVLLVAASAFHPPPPESMDVEVIQLKDAPGFGPMTKPSSPADGQAPVTQAPPPKPRTEPTTERQESKTAAAQRLQAPEASQADLVRAEPDKQDTPPEAQPAPAAPPEPTPEQPNIAELATEYAQRGGLFGGFGHEAGEDFTLPFRQRLVSCSKPPDGLGPSDRVIIRVRMSFNPDGSLSSRPRLLVPTPSAKQRALWASVADALESCQPFTMLPPDKYNLWKTLVWYVGFPVNALFQ